VILIHRKECVIVSVRRAVKLTVESDYCFTDFIFIA